MQCNDAGNQTNFFPECEEPGELASALRVRKKRLEMSPAAFLAL